MTKLIIKKGEFNIFENLYNRESYLKFADLIREINNTNNNYHDLKDKITKKKNNLIEVFGNKFTNDFFDINTENINQKKKYISEIYNKYDFKKYSTALKEIVIEDNIELADFNLDFANYIFTSLDIKKCIKGDLIIRNWNAASNNFNNFIIEKNCIIYSGNNINFINSKFGTEGNYVFELRNGRGKNYTFENCFFNNLEINNIKTITISELAINIYINKCTGNLNLNNNDINFFNIKDSDFKSISLTNNIFKERFKISSEIIVEGEIRLQKIGSLIFSNNSINNLRIGHSDFETLYLDNIKNPTNSEINIGNILVKNLTFSNIRNLGIFRIYDINYGKKENSYESITIKESSLGNSEFQNINLNSFKDIIIFDNLFSDLKYTGIIWGYNIQVDKNENLGKLRNTYRTLKDVAGKNNDNITELKFYSQEMKTYKKYIFDKKGYFNQDYIITFFNEFSSNFGLDFIRPFLLIILTNLLFIFIIMILSSEFKFIGFSWENILNGISYFSRGLYLTNGIEGIFGEKIKNGLFDLLIILKNLFMGIFIYQTILAFRKFSRNI